MAHASVIVDAGDCRIWSDPWLFGKAFNDSWSLAPPAVWDPDDLDAIHYLWISHEHPDHFHVPTLRFLPSEFKQRVMVLYQRNNSTKMFDALEKLGFCHFTDLPHRKSVSLTPNTSVYCYQQGVMNSALLINSGSYSLLNVNDAELRSSDCRLILQDAGPVDVVLNQFSVAGYNGALDVELNVRRDAQKVLTNLVNNHIDLCAKFTVPFASFMYFSTEDNRYMNRYVNRPTDVVSWCQPRGVRTVILYPGDRWDSNRIHNNAPALERYAEYYASEPSWDFDAPSQTPLDVLKADFAEHAERIAERFPRVLLSRLHPVITRIPDLNVTVRSSLYDRTFESVDQTSNPPQIEVLSQPLQFLYRFPFGSQTLGVSARLRVVGDDGGNWRRHRILYSLNNAELYLKPTLLLRRRNLSFASHRLRGGLHQIRERISSM